MKDRSTIHITIGSDDLPSDLDMGYITSVTKLIVATILKEAITGTS